MTDRVRVYTVAVKSVFEVTDMLIMTIRMLAGTCPYHNVSMMKLFTNLCYYKSSCICYYVRQICMECLDAAPLLTESVTW